MPLGSKELPKITIVARNDGKGKGILWDHLTIRSLVNAETYVAYNEAMQTDTMCRERLELNDTFTQRSHFLEPADYGQGLLIIAGRSRLVRPAHRAAHDARLEFEQAIIKNALETKRPILAICGGSWSLWQALGGGYELTKVIGHDIVESHPKDDIYLEANGKVHSNVQVHDIDVSPDSTLAKAMGLDGERTSLSVNSIHQVVLDEKSKAEKTKITARTKKSLLDNPDLTTDSIEAFETEDGSAIGVQFHPEAYSPGDPSYKEMQSLFKFMVAKGQDYDRARQKKFFFEKGADVCAKQHDDREALKITSPT